MILYGYGYTAGYSGIQRNTYSSGGGSGGGSAAAAACNMAIYLYIYVDVDVRCRYTRNKLQRHAAAAEIPRIKDTVRCEAGYRCNTRGIIL